MSDRSESTQSDRTQAFWNPGSGATNGNGHRHGRRNSNPLLADAAGNGTGAGAAPARPAAITRSAAITTVLPGGGSPNGNGRFRPGSLPGPGGLPGGGSSTEGGTLPGVDGAPAGAAPFESPPNKWVITFAVTVGTLMGAIDSSIVNVALPYIQSNLGVTIDEITWVSTGYLISLVIIMPLTAWLGGMFGRKRVYMFCLALFILSSFFCGFADSLPELVVFRILQGVGAGALQPTEQAILRETFPVEEQGVAMSLYGLAVMIGPAVGPTLGGWITDNYTWRWIFFINIPIGILGLLMVWRVVQDPPFLKNRAPARIDYVGIGLLAVGLGTLQTMLEEGERYDWFTSGFINILLVVALVTLTAFIYWELTTDSPAVDLRLLKNVPFAVGTSIGGVLGISLFSTLFLLPQYTENLLNYTPMQTGLALMPRSLAMIVLMPITGLLYNRLGARKMIGGGLIVSAYAGWMMTRFSSQTGYNDLLLPQVVQGVGFSMIFVALSTAALATVPRTRLTNGAGLYNLIRQLGASFGTAVAATILLDHESFARSQLVQNVNPFNPVFQRYLGGLEQKFLALGLGAHQAELKAMAVINQMVEGQAAVLGFTYVFSITALLLLACLPLVLMMKDTPRTGSKSPDSHVSIE